jgi:hypothetical protein
MVSKLAMERGCYLIRIESMERGPHLHGTLRVDRGQAPDAEETVVTGDLYETTSQAACPAGNADGNRGIPIFPRSTYRSYLQVRSASIQSNDRLLVVADEYAYTPPRHPNQRGSFTSVPTPLTLDLTTSPSSPGHARYEGRARHGERDIGDASLTWVSPRLRRSELYVHTLPGAVAPAPVTDGGLPVYFDTVFERTGWELTIHASEIYAARPEGDRWSSGYLSQLLETVRAPDLTHDERWRVDLLVVPRGMDTGLGVMFDLVNRSAAACFSDGRYSAIHSAGYGAAAGRMQRDVPRAFLRNALHEVTHAFNQLDQHRLGADDNSIMTTTPRLAELLSIEGAVRFPEGIRLRHNDSVRHLLNHLPDPVVRPGGWPFGSWITADVPGLARQPVRYSRSPVARAVDSR